VSLRSRRPGRWVVDGVQRAYDEHGRADADGGRDGRNTGRDGDMLLRESPARNKNLIFRPNRPEYQIKYDFKFKLNVLSPGAARILVAQ